MYGPSTWHPDTAAINHIPLDLTNLQSAEEYQGSDKLIVGNGIGLNIAHTGASSLHSQNRVSKLSNILHVPRIAKHILFVQQFAIDNDVYFKFRDRYFVIKDEATKQQLPQGTTEDGVQKFQGIVKSSPQAFSAAKDNYEQWHARLGHPAFQIVKHVLHSLNLSPSVLVFNECSSYLLSKTIRISLPSTNNLARFPLDLMHSDVWGLTPISSINGEFCFVLFVDDHSKYTWFY